MGLLYTEVEFFTTFSGVGSMGPMVILAILLQDVYEQLWGL